MYYKFSFINNVENQYTRIYHLDGVSVSIQTCQMNCFSCWESYFECTVCTDQNYAQLFDKEGECFPPTYIVENYIYDSNENVFKKCYKNCEFCSESGGTDEDQQCCHRQSDTDRHKGADQGKSELSSLSHGIPSLLLLHSVVSGRAYIRP